ncbi:hypothetical protein ASB57_01475 [Bordetella sp. N]|nr:hypothetical protein ASB57_01475 [Bordetella sp. N]
MRAAFNDLLKQRIGVDAEAIGQATIDRAVRLRAQTCSQGDAMAYWRLLAGSRDEQQHLIETVVVPETSFFRHAASMDALALLARQRIANGGALRLLSLPCSSGEEAYTLAMALLDAGVDASRFSVVGMDISARLVQHARQGIYGRNSFRGEALGYRARHFEETAAGYAVLPRVRAEVSFQTGNLLDPLLDLPPAGFDFVFCRNLLIYFDEATQRAAVNVLMGLARADGYLFVGPAEASLLTHMGLRQIDAPGAFAFHRQVPPPKPGAAAARQAVPRASGRAGRPTLPRVDTQRHESTAPPISPGAAGTTAGMAPRPDAASASRATPQRGPIHPTPAGATAQGTSAQGAAAKSGGTPPAAAAKDTLAAVQALADSGRIAAALDAGARHLEQHGASAPAYYLIGVLHDATGAHASAESAYRKALYLDPDHHEALLHLASLVEARGDAPAARQLRQRAARAGGRDA